ncbi:DUF1294 domain-containing protein [Paenibacillus sp. LMG 31456]|uniref:DUF1294 domain-containing protein n=1 Tax=Paenibacillus foliorum TaxID=2654974 RepID=A0A972GM94_9BACL|nr:DUF1294 domain-containing protein [Paenibacillus foliorum]NOU93319.1 DUF1294 domain-containing protein [Paenibacillus foliorum]
MKWIYVYLILMNIIAFVSMGLDKSKAKRKARRISEKRLFTFAALGGAAGAWLAMRLFRHKTKHKSFVIGIPLLLLLHVVIFYYFKLWT